jgi:hypothetical protein
MCVRPMTISAVAGWHRSLTMAAPAHLLSAFVFLVFLLRHGISCALALYPGESWLWQLSLTFGYDLLPILTLLRDEFNFGLAGTFAVLAGLTVAAYAKNLFVSLLVLHVGAFACWYCWLIARSRHPPALNADLQSLQIAGILPTTSLLQVLCLGLLVACLHGHGRYLKLLRDDAAFRARGNAEHGIVGARK